MSLFSVALFLASSALSAAPVDIDSPVVMSLVAATAQRSCGGDDGPATELRFPVSGERWLSIWLAARPENAAGHWTVRTPSSTEPVITGYSTMIAGVVMAHYATPGSDSAANYRIGARLTAGWVDTLKPVKGAISGILDVTFDSGVHVTGPFTAKVVSRTIEKCR